MDISAVSHKELRSRWEGGEVITHNLNWCVLTLVGSISGHIHIYSMHFMSLYVKHKAAHVFI